jgi:hypothetical protein
VDGEHRVHNLRRRDLREERPAGEDQIAWGMGAGLIGRRMERGGEHLVASVDRAQRLWFENAAEVV